MSLAAQYTALYKLFYKFGVRDAFLQGKFDRFEGLTDAEQAEITRAAGQRLDFVAHLHAGEIGVNWYMQRFPASWIGLQVALDCDSRELASRFTDTDEFELRVNDDSDGRALAAWVQRLAETRPRKPPNSPKPAPPLANAPWLPELLRYERMINGIWPDDTNPRVETFEWDTGGISESLLRKQLFPVDEKPVPLEVLLYRDEAGVTEVALLPDQARVMRKLINRESVADEPPKLVAKCRRGLRQIRA